MSPYLPEYAVYTRLRGGEWRGGRPDGRPAVVSSVAGMSPDELREVKKLPAREHEIAAKAARRVA